jgi:hypothetical protein
VLSDAISPEIIMVFGIFEVFDKVGIQNVHPTML